MDKSYQKLKEARAKNKTITALAKELNVSRQTVYKRLGNYKQIMQEAAAAKKSARHAPHNKIRPEVEKAVIEIALKNKRDSILTLTSKLQSEHGITIGSATIFRILKRNNIRNEKTDVPAAVPVPSQNKPFLPTVSTALLLRSLGISLSPLSSKKAGSLVFVLTIAILSAYGASHFEPGVLSGSSMAKAGRVLTPRFDPRHTKVPNLLEVKNGILDSMDNFSLETFSSYEFSHRIRIFLGGGSRIVRIGDLPMGWRLAGRTMNRGMVLGAFASVEASDSKNDKSGFPFLDQLSLSFYCSFASLSDTLNSDRCNYDVLASGSDIPSPVAVSEEIPAVPVSEAKKETVTTAPLTTTFTTTNKPILITEYVTKYVYIPGPAGRDGQDGQNGRDGRDGIAGSSLNNVTIPSGFGSYVIPSISSPSTAIGISTVGYLKDTTVDSPIINSGTATSLSLVTPTLRNAAFNGLSLFSDSAIFTGNVIVNNLTATSSTFVDTTTTNANVMNLVVSSSTFSDAIITNSTTTNAYVDSLAVGAITSGTVTLNGGLSVNGTSTLATTTVSDFTASHATSTSLFSALLTAVTGLFTDLTATNATTTNFFTQNLAVGNASIEGDQTIDGTFGVTGTSTLGANVFLNGNVVIGTSSNEMLTVNSLVNSNFTPAANISYDLGSPSFYWRDIYADDITVNTISAGASNIAGTLSNTFTINTANGTIDDEDSSLVFFRGLVTPNALIRWNSLTKRLESNMSFKVQNETPSTGTTTLTVQSGAGQTSINLFELLNYAGTKLSVFNADGWLGLGSSTPGSMLTVTGASSLATTTITGTLTVNGNTNITQGGTLTVGDKIIAPGEIGAGTSSPSGKIAIQNTLADQVAFLIYGTSTQTAPLINVFDYPGSNQSIFSVSATGTLLAAALSITSGISSPTISIAGTSTFATAGGNLGIGTTTPTSILHIQQPNDTSGITINGSTIPSSYLKLSNDSGGYSNINAAQGFRFMQAGTNIAYISSGAVDGFRLYDNVPLSFGATTATKYLMGRDNTSGNFRFAYGGVISTDANVKLTMTPDGKLGIGTTSPTSLLSVMASSTAPTSPFISFNSTTSPIFNVLANGNVGIGTANPSNKLQVVDTTAGQALFSGWSATGGAAAYNGTIYIGNTSAYQGVIDYNANAASILSISNTDVAGSLYLKTASTTRMVINSNGNIGIGTTTPGTYLPNGWNSNASSKMLEIASLGTNYDSGILLRRSDSFTGLDLWSDNNIGDVYIDNYYNNVNGDIRFRTRTSGTPVDAMTVTGSGNVGIGTTTPGKKVEIALGTMSDLANEGLLISGNATDQVGYLGTVMDLDNSSDNAYGFVRMARTSATAYLGMEIGSDSRDGIRFLTGNNAGNGTATEYMRITSSGNVGIGTTNPSTGHLEIVTNTNTPAIYLSGAQAGWGTGIQLANTTAVTGKTYGMYSAAGGQFSISDNGAGVDRIRIENTGNLSLQPSSGNVGIGTTDPGKTLDVNGQIRGTTQLTVTSGATQNAISIQGTSQDLGLELANSGTNGRTYQLLSTNTGSGVAAGSFRIYDASGGGDRLVINSSGNVGIGTTNPGTKLEVNGTVRGGLYQTTVTSGNIIEQHDAGWSNNSYILNTGWAAGSGDYTRLSHGGNGAVGNYLEVNETQGVIIPTGNVGIGTTNPGAALHLFKNANEVSILQGADTAGYTTYKNNAGTTLGYFGYATPGAVFTDAITNSMVLRGEYGVQLGTGSGADLTVSTTGNVGIGVADPQAHLEVASNSFISAGTQSQYVPVVFFTRNNKNTFYIKRENIHEDRDWLAHGIVTITSMGNGWGSGGNSVSANVSTHGALNADSSGGTVPFVGRIRVDGPSSGLVIVWLRGGTTYYTDGIVSDNDGSYSDSYPSPGIYTSVNIPAAGYGLNKGQYHALMDIDASSPNYESTYSFGGNVGIGTTNPDSQLYVNGGTAMTAGWNKTATLQATYPTLVFNSNGSKWGGIGYDHSAAMRFWVNSSSNDVPSVSPAMSILNNGNVGIGAADPGTNKLKVVTNIGTGIYSTTAGGTGWGGEFYNTDGGGNRYAQLAGPTYSAIFMNGNVGIGTAAPAQKLQVNGNIQLGASLNAISSLGDLLYFSDAGNNSDSIWLARYNTANDQSQLRVNIGDGDDPNDYVDFGYTYWSDSNWYSKMVIRSDGRVGIGTTNPGTKLDVNGTIRSYVPSGNSEISQVTSGGVTFAWQTFNTVDLKLHTDAAGGRDVLGILGNNGYVGIGTTNPSTKLDVVDSNSSATSPAAQIIGASPTKPALVVGQWQNAAGIPAFEVRGNVDRNGGGAYSGGSTNLFTVMADGKVGIGTSNPARALEVNSVMKFTNGSADANDGVIGTAPFAAGLNIVGINTDGTGRQINEWGSIIQQENTVGNSFIGNTNFPGSGIWNSSGTVGIGTAAPNTKLHVQGAGGAGIARFTTSDYADGAAGSGLVIYTGTPTGNTYTVLNAYSAGFSAWNNLIMQSGGGNVGIGTTNPGAKLEVNGSIRGNISGALRIDSGNGIVDIGAMNTGLAHIYTDRPAFYTDKGMYIGAANSYFNTSADNSYIAANGGYVGIGTTNPGTKLDVSGDVRSTGTYYQNNGSPTIVFQDSDERSGVIHVNSNLMYFLSGNGVNGSSWARNGSYWPLTLNMNSDAAIFGGPAYFMEGYVGIGTTNPGHALDVVGNVAASNFYGGGVYVSDDICSTTYGCFSGFSDERLKENVAPLGSTLDRVMQLKPVTYTWNQTYFDLRPNQAGATSTKVGFIAQDVLALFPETVNPQDPNGYYTLDYEKFAPILASAIQEQQAQINPLTSSITVSSSSLASARLFINPATGVVGIGNNGIALDGELLHVSGTIRAEGFDIDNAADIAENYPALEAVDAGTVVAFGSSTVSWNQSNDNVPSESYEISGVRKAADGYEAVGVISTKAGITLGGDTTDGVPVALSGRVPVKVTTENGEVKRGDYLTVSLTRPGYAMKLIGEGKSIGRVLSDYTEGRDKVMMIVESGYQRLDMAGRYATTTGMLTTGNVDLNANGVAIYNIKSLASANGTWSIDENGRITVKVLCLEDVCIDKTQLTNILNLTGQGAVDSGAVDTVNTVGSSTITGEIAGVATSTEQIIGSEQSAVSSNTGTTEESVPTTIEPVSPPAEEPAPVVQVEQEPTSEPTETTNI